jgi:hypothetical protein
MVDGRGKVGSSIYHPNIKGDRNHGMREKMYECAFRVEILPLGDGEGGEVGVCKHAA